MPTTVVACVPDLMDRSKVAALGDVRFVPRAADLAAAARDHAAGLVVLDLAAPGAVDALAGIGARTVGFGRHTAVELLEAARAAGCDEVLTRAEFFARLERGGLGRPPG